MRYCDTDAANRLNCLSPRTSVKVTCVPPKRSPPLVTPRLTGGRPSRNSFSNVPLRRAFDCTSVWLMRRLEVDDRPWRAEIGAGHGRDGRLARERVDAVFTLVVGDEGNLCRLLIVQDDGRDVAGQRVRVLLQLACLQAQRPDVVDVAVAGDFRVDRLVRIRLPSTGRSASRRPGTAPRRRRECRR